VPRYALTKPGIRRGLDRVAADHPAIRNAIDRLGYPSSRRVPEGFGTLLRIIVSQQVSTAAAATIYGRLADRLSDPDDPAALLRLRRPTLRKAGLSGQKTEYVRAVAKALDSGVLDLVALRRMPDEQAIDALTAVKGLGRWSANVYLMFALGRPDLWPTGDLGVRVGLGHILGWAERPTPAQTRALGEPWRPHRSCVAMLCWASVNAAPTD
jgi:DNA-3-methyladenine glycosylase II